MLTRRQLPWLAAWFSDARFFEPLRGAARVTVVAAPAGSGETVTTCAKACTSGNTRIPPPPNWEGRSCPPDPHSRYRAPPARDPGERDRTAAPRHPRKPGHFPGTRDCARGGPDAIAGVIAFLVSDPAAAVSRAIPAGVQRLRRLTRRDAPTAPTRTGSASTVASAPTPLGPTRSPLEGGVGDLVAPFRRASQQPTTSSAAASSRRPCTTSPIARTRARWG